MSNLSNSDVIAISSVAIALLAMFATFWQAHIARRHNRLSVRPFMEHRQERIPGQHVTVSIVNHGLGPATLTTVFFTVLSCPDKLTIDDFLDRLVLAMKPTNGEWESVVFQGKNAIPPGREVPLIKLELTAADDENLKIISKCLNETTIHIA